MKETFNKAPNVTLLLKRVKFVGSYPKVSNFPSLYPVELYFFGRSNVGKSSLINVICNQKIAKTSKTPGKTKFFNFYDIDGLGYIIDMPGYGYAKVSKTLRKAWLNEMAYILNHRKKKKIFFHLVDSHISLMASDQLMMDMFMNMDIPYVIILTKIDKCNQKQRHHIYHRLNLYLNQNKHKEVPIIGISSVKKIGLEDIYQMIGDILDVS